MTPNPAQVAYLATQRLGRLATLNPRTGLLHNSPVTFWYDEESNAFVIGGRAMGETRKFANVEATGVATLVVDDVVDPTTWVVRGVEIRGSAEALRGITPRAGYFSAEEIRIHPTRIVSWGLDES